MSKGAASTVPYIEVDRSTKRFVAAATMLAVQCQALLTLNAVSQNVAPMLKERLNEFNEALNGKAES